VAAGFSGHGMTRTFTCGRVIADMVAGAPYDPNFPATWLPSPGRFGPAIPIVPGPEAAAGAVYV
jgi:glycine/D-amino acid oxidase-like deaminating enzyme